MRALTPTERAVATYCADWSVSPLDRSGLARVNSETLNQGTSPECLFRYIDISSVNHGAIDWASVPRLRFADAPSRARRVVRSGDAMICTVRPLLGSHAFMESDAGEPTVCSTGFAVVRPDRDLHPHFLRHLPFADQVTRQLVAWQCGTNYPAVNERDIRRLLVPVPPPDEQAAIARILDAVDTALQRTRAAVERARDVKRGCLQRFFYDALGETAYADRPKRKLPIGWALLPTQQLLADDPKNGLSPESSTQPPGVPTFSIAAIRDGRVDLDTREHLKFARVGEKVAERYRVRRGDVLVVRGNANPDLVGKAGMVDRFPDGCIYPDITMRVAFRSDREPKVSSDYAVLAWNHPVVHNQVLRRSKTSNGTLKINSRDVNQIVMPVPPDHVQAELVRNIGAVDALIDALTAVGQAQVALKRSLMHDLLTGRVRVGDAAKAAAS